MNNFRRWIYLDKIFNTLKKEKLILLVWPRQVGKTTLLKILQNELKEKTYYYSFEDEFEKLSYSNKTEFISFFQTILWVDFYSKGILMLDEFQYVFWWNKILKSLYDDNKVKLKIIATGSWMWNLKEDNSSLVWRWEEIFVYPFSFFEFIEIKWYNLTNFSINSYNDLLAKYFSKAYEEFLIFGWYPAVVLAQTKQEKIKNLEKIIKKYIEKDISFFLSEQDFINFKKFFLYFVSQIWNLIKKESIANYLWIKTKKVEKYLMILEKTLFLSFAYPFFKNKQKEYSQAPKAYFVDVGIVNFLKKNFEFIDFWINNEHFIFNELQKSKQYNQDEIKIYKKLSKSEIDFIYDGLEKLIPIEVKSSNSLAIPKIFYSFEKDYWEKVNFYVKTTKTVFDKTKIEDKDLLFIPNFLISKIL